MWGWSVTRMRDALSAGQTTASALLSTHLQRYERVNPAIHAVIKTRIDAARIEAQDADRALARGEVDWAATPLLGIPMTVKDNFDVSGMTSTIGMPWLRGNLASTDATLVQKLRSAGAVVWGKTNVPFASYDWQTTSPTDPRANNPRDVRYGPGGSSGGSAAALAAGITPLELGSDVAGSVRNPASACGVVGLRPSEGLLSSSGHGRMPGVAHAMRSLATPSPMARNIADLRTIFAVLRGSDPHEPRLPWRPGAEPMPAREVRGLRVGFFHRVGEIEPAAEVRTAFEDALGRLRSAGAILEQADLGSAVDLPQTSAAWGTIQGFEIRHSAPFMLRAAPLAGLSGAGYYAMRYRGAFGRSVARGWLARSITYFRALDQRDDSAAAADTFFARFDAWVCPVWPITALAHQKTGAPVRIDDRIVPYGDALGAYTVPTAALGVPVATLPIGSNPHGLPIGMQVFARRWEDVTLLSLVEGMEPVLGGAMPVCDPSTGPR